MATPKVKRCPVFYYVLVEYQGQLPRHKRRKIVVIRARFATKGCLPSKVKRANGPGDGGSWRRKGSARRRSPTPPLQTRPPTLLLPPMVERVQDITATTPVQNCKTDRLTTRNLTSPVIPTAPSPGHLFYNSEDRSDLHFLVGREGWRFPAHSFVIGRERTTLAALLNRAQREAGFTDEETAPIVLRLPDMEPEIFEQMLRFIYTGQISFSSVDSTLRLLHPCQIFHLPRLAQQCLNHLSTSLNCNNVLAILSHLIYPENDLDRKPTLPSNTGPASVLDSHSENENCASNFLCNGPEEVKIFFPCNPNEVCERPERDVHQEICSASSKTITENSMLNLVFTRSVSENDCAQNSRIPGFSSKLIPSENFIPPIVSPKNVSERSTADDNGHLQPLLSDCDKCMVVKSSLDSRLKIKHPTENRCDCTQFGVRGDCCASSNHACSDDCCHDNDNMRNELLIRCFQVVDSQADLVLSSEFFETLDHPLLLDIIRRDTLGVSSEASVFEAIMRWACRTCKRTRKELTPENKCCVLGEALFLVRYLTMTLEEFLRGPVSQGVLSKEDKELFLSRLTNRITDPLPDRWRRLKVSVPRWKNQSLLSPEQPSVLAEASTSPTDVNEPVGTKVKRKKSMSKKLLNGVGDLVICVIQLLD